MKRLFIILTLLLSYCNLFSQIATIDGCVIDSVTGKVIETASISIIDNQQSEIPKFGGRFIDGATTDAEGNFSCSGMVIGRYYKVYIATGDWVTVHMIKIQSVKMNLNFVICKKFESIL